MGHEQREHVTQRLLRDVVRRVDQNQIAARLLGGRTGEQRPFHRVRADPDVDAGQVEVGDVLADHGDGSPVGLDQQDARRPPACGLEPECPRTGIQVKDLRVVNGVEVLKP